MRILGKIKGCLRSLSVMIAVALCVLTGGTLSGVEKFAKGKGSNVANGNPAVTFLAQIVTSEQSQKDQNGLDMFVYVDAYGNATTQTLYTDGANRYFDTFVKKANNKTIIETYKSAMEEGTTNLVYDEQEPLANADLNFYPIYYNTTNRTEGYFTDDKAYLKKVTPSSTPSAVPESENYYNGVLYAFSRASDDNGIYSARKIYKFKQTSGGSEKLTAYYGDVEGSAVLIVDFASYSVDSENTVVYGGVTYYAYTNGSQTYYVTNSAVTENIFTNSLVLYTLSGEDIVKFVDLRSAKLSAVTKTAEFTELYAPEVFESADSTGYTTKTATVYLGVNDGVPNPGYYQVYQNTTGDIVIYKDYLNLTTKQNYFYSFTTGQWAEYSPTLPQNFAPVNATREVSFTAEATTTANVYRIGENYYELTFDAIGRIASIEYETATELERKTQTAKILIAGTEQECDVYKYLNTYNGKSLTVYSPNGTQFYNGNGEVFHGDMEFFAKQYDSANYTLEFTVYEKSGSQDIYAYGIDEDSQNFYTISTDAKYGDNGVYDVYKAGSTTYYKSGSNYYSFVERSYYSNFINQNISAQVYNKADALAGISADLTTYGFSAEGVQVLHNNGIPTYHTNYFSLLYLSRSAADPIGQRDVYNDGTSAHFIDRMFYNSSSMVYNVAKATYKLNDAEYGNIYGMGYVYSDEEHRAYFYTKHDRIKSVKGESQDKNAENYGAKIDSQNVLGATNYNIVSTLNNGDTYLLKDKGVSNIDSYSLRISLAEFGLPIINNNAQIVVQRDGAIVDSYTTAVSSLGQIYSHTNADGSLYFDTNSVGGTAVNNGSDYAYGAILNIPYSELISGKYEIFVSSSALNQNIQYLDVDGITHLDLASFKIEFTIVKEVEYFTELIVPTIQKATQNETEKSKILYYNLTAENENNVSLLTFNPSKFAVLISHAYSTSIVNYEIKQTNYNTIKITKTTFNAVGQQIGGAVTKNIGATNSLTLQLEKLGQYTVKYYPMVNYQPLKLDNYTPRWEEGVTSEGFSGVNNNSASFDQLMLKVFGFETYYSPNNTGTDEFYRLKGIQNLDDFFTGTSAYTGDTLNANISGRFTAANVPTTSTASSIFDSLNVVSTNQPSVSFKSSALLSVSSYYLFRPFNSSVWNEYNYYSNTRFSNPGDYMVVLNFRDAKVNGVNSPFTNEQKTQVFAFSIKMTNPSVELVKIDKDGNEITGGKIEDLTYTNNSVKLKVSQDSIFDSKPLVYAYQSRTDYLSHNDWFDYGTTPKLLTLNNDGENLSYTFSESRAYYLEIVYGPSSLVDQSTFVSAEFVIDKNPLQIVPTQTNNGVTKAITSDSVEAITGSFSIEYVAKLSGAKIVKAEYSLTKLIGDYTPNASNSSIVTTDDDKQIVLNGLSLDFANKQTGLAYATSETGKGYGRTFSESGLYEFRFEDEAGNVNTYYIMLDNLSPSYVLKEYNADEDKTLDSAFSEVTWGDYKGVNAGSSEITLTKTALNGTSLPASFESKLFTYVTDSNKYYYTAAIALASTSKASTYVTFKTSGNPSFVTTSSSFTQDQLTQEAIDEGISVYRDLTASGFKALATKRNEGVFVFQVADIFGNQSNSKDFSFNFDLSETTTYALNEDINLAKYGNTLRIAFGASEFNSTNFDYLALTSKVDGSTQYSVDNIEVNFYPLTASGYDENPSKSLTIYSKGGADLRWDGISTNFASYAFMLLNGITEEGKFEVVRTYSDGFVQPMDLFEAGVTTDEKERKWVSFVDRTRLFDEVNGLTVGEGSSLTLGSESKEFTNFVFGEDANVKVSLETNLAPILINIVENKFGVAITNANGEQLDSFKFSIRLRGVYNGRTWLDTNFEKLAMVYNGGFISLNDLIGSVYEAQNLGKSEGLIYESTYILDVYDGANSFITGFDEKSNSVTVKFVIKSNKPNASVNKIGEENVVYFTESTLNGLEQTNATMEPGVNYISYTDGTNTYYKLGDNFYTYNAETKSVTSAEIDTTNLSLNYETRVVDGVTYNVYLNAESGVRYLYAGDVYRISPSGIKYNDGKAAVSFEAGEEETALVDTTIYYNNDGYSEIATRDFIDISIYNSVSTDSTYVKIYNNYYLVNNGVYENKGTTLPEGYTLTNDSAVVYSLVVNKTTNDYLYKIEGNYYSISGDVLTAVTDETVLANYLDLNVSYLVYSKENSEDLYKINNKYYRLNGAFEYVSDELPTGYIAKQEVRQLTVGDEKVTFSVFEDASGVTYYYGDPGDGYEGEGYYTLNAGVLTFANVEGSLTARQVSGTFNVMLYQDASSNRRYGFATSSGLSLYTIVNDKFVELDRVYRANGTNAYFTLNGSDYIEAVEGSYNFTGFTFKMNYKADRYNLQTGELYFEILGSYYEVIEWTALNIAQMSLVENVVDADGFTQKPLEETLQLTYVIYELKGDESIVIYEMGGKFYATPNGDLTSPLTGINIDDYSTIGKTVVINGIEYDVKQTQGGKFTFYIDSVNHYLYNGGKLIRVVVDGTKTEGESGTISSYRVPVGVPVVYQDNETIDTILISVKTEEDVAAVLTDVLDEYQAKIDFATSTINGAALSEIYNITTANETVYNIVVNFKGNVNDFNYTFNYGIEGNNTTINGFTTQIVLAVDSTKPNTNIDRLYSGEFEISYHYVSDEEYVDFSFRTDEETASNPSAILDEFYYEGSNIREYLAAHFEGKDFTLSAYSASRYPSLYKDGNFILSSSEVDGIIYFSFDFANPNFTNDRLYAFAQESGVLTVRSLTYTDTFLDEYLKENNLDYSIIKESGALKDYVFTVDENHVFERAKTSGSDEIDELVSAALNTSDYIYRLDTSRIFIRAVPTTVTSVGTDWSKPSDLPDEASYTENNNRPKFALTSPSYTEISYNLTLKENLSLTNADFSGYSIFEIVEMDGAGNYRSYFICYKPYANETEINAKYQNYFNNIGNATISGELYNKTSSLSDGSVINSAKLESFEITSLIASNEWFTVKVYRNDGEQGFSLVSIIYNKYITNSNGVYESNSRSLSELNTLVKEAISPNGVGHEGRQFNIVVLDRYTRKEITITVNFATIGALEFTKQVSPNGAEIDVYSPENPAGGLTSGTQIQSLTVTEYNARSGSGAVRVTDANGKSITTQKGEQYIFNANNNKSLYLFSYYDNFGRLINESFSTAEEKHAFYTDYALTNMVSEDSASGTVLYFAYQTLYYTGVSFTYKDANSDVAMVVVPTLTNTLETGVRICRFDLPFGVNRVYTAILTDRASTRSSYSARAYKILPELNFASNNVDLTGNFITISETDDKLVRELITPVTNMTINLIDNGAEFSPTAKAIITRNTTTETRNNIFGTGVTVTYSANGRYQVIVSNTVGTVVEYIFNIADENAIVYTIQDSRTKATLNAGLTLFRMGEYTGRQYFTTDSNFILTTAKTKGVNVVNEDMTLSTSLLTEDYTSYAVRYGIENNNTYYIFHIYASGMGSAFAYDEYIKVTIVPVSTSNSVLGITAVGYGSGEIVTTDDDFSLTYNTNPTGNYYYAEVYYRSPNNLASIKLPTANGSSYNATNTLTFSEAGTYYVQFKDIAGNVFTFNSQQFLKVVVLTKIMANASTSGVLNSYNDYAIDGLVVEGGAVTIAVENADKFIDNSESTLATSVNKNGIAYTIDSPSLFTLNGVGVYDITVSGTYNKVNLTNTFRIIVVNPNEARLGLEYLVNTNIEILSVTRGTLTSEGNNITDQLASKQLLNISNNTLGDGLYTVKVNASFNSEFRSDTTFTFSVFISNASPLIQCNQTLGETTTKTIEIKYNPAVIYSTQANCRIEITGFEPIVINSSNKDDNTFHTVTIKDAGKYDIKLYSESGQSLFYWASITKKDPLNGVAILLIVIGSALGVGLIVTFILLRTRMKVR